MERAGVHLVLDRIDLKFPNDVTLSGVELYHRDTLLANGALQFENLVWDEGLYISTLHSNDLTVYVPDSGKVWSRWANTLPTGGNVATSISAIHAQEIAVEGFGGSYTIGLEASHLNAGGAFALDSASIKLHNGVAALEAYLGGLYYQQDSIYARTTNFESNFGLSGQSVEPWSQKQGAIGIESNPNGVWPAEFKALGIDAQTVDYVGWAHVSFGWNRDTVEEYAMYANSTYGELSANVTIDHEDTVAAFGGKVHTLPEVELSEDLAALANSELPLEFGIHWNNLEEGVRYTVVTPSSVGSGVCYVDERQVIGKAELNESIDLFSPLKTLETSYTLAFNEDYTIAEANGLVTRAQVGDVELQGVLVNYTYEDLHSLQFSSIDRDFDLTAEARWTEDSLWSSGDLMSLNLGVFMPLHRGDYLETSYSLATNFRGLGTVTMENSILTKPEEVVFVRSLQAQHSMSGAQRSIAVESDALVLAVEGSYDLEDLEAVGVGLIQHLNPGDQRDMPWKAGVSLAAKASFGSVYWLLDYLDPQLFLGESTWEASYNGDTEHLSVTAALDESGYGKHQLYQTDVALALVGDSVNVDLEVTQGWVLGKMLERADLSYHGALGDRSLDFQGTLDDSIPYRFDFNGAIGLDSAVLNAGTFNIGLDTFAVEDTSALYWSANGLDFEELSLTSTAGRVDLMGVLGPNENGALRLQAKGIQARPFNYMLNHLSYTLAGQMDVDFIGTQLLTTPDIHAQVWVSSVALDKVPLGNLGVFTNWSQSHDSLPVSWSLQQGNRQVMSGLGGYYWGLDSTHFEVEAQHMNIAVLGAMIGESIDSLAGSVTGRGELYGSLRAINSEGDFKWNSGRVHIPITGVTYEAVAPVDLRITPGVINIPWFEIEDSRYGLPGRARIQVNHSHFKDFALHIEAGGDSVIAVDGENHPDAAFYGQAFTDGAVEISGPVEDLKMELTAKSLEGTRFKVPLENPEGAELPSFVSFVAPVTAGDTVKAAIDNLFVMDAHLDITEDAFVELVMDETLGDIIQGRGSGRMEFKILENDALEMYGTYTISEGSYLFTLGNLINKSFHVEEGGTVFWNGSIYDAALNLNAVYKVNTTLNGLVNSSDYTGQQVPVDLRISVTGSLEQPEIAFSFDLPTAPAHWTQELNRHMLTQDEVNYQAFSLLVLGAFIPGQLGVQEQFNVGSSLEYNTTEVLVSQFGNWIAKGLGTYLEVELDYTASNPYDLAQNQDLINLGLGRSFLDGRLQVNSSFEVPIGQETGTGVFMLGDTEVVYSITPSGRIKIKAFNKSNRNDPFSTDVNPYSQGVGIRYEQHFDGNNQESNGSGESVEEAPSEESDAEEEGSGND